MKACLLTAHLLIIALASSNACGDIVINATESSGDVVFQGSGDLDLTGLGMPTDLTRPGRVQANEFLLIGPEFNVDFDIYDVALGGPSQIGPGTTLFNASSGSGDVFGLDFAFGNLAVPDNYVSNTQLSGISTYSNQTFQSMGLATGTYSWTVGSNSFQLNIVAVPEPSSAIGMLAFFGIMFGSRRRRFLDRNRSTTV